MRLISGFPDILDSGFWILNSWGVLRVWLAALALFALSVALYSWRLDVPDVYGDDESLDAGVVTEMVTHHEWLFPRFNGQMIPEKTPLYFWLASLTSLARGG